MVMLGPPCNLSDRHATVGDKLGNDQTMPRDIPGHRLIVAKLVADGGVPIAEVAGWAEHYHAGPVLTAPSQAQRHPITGGPKRAR